MTLLKLPGNCDLSVFLTGKECPSLPGNSESYKITYFWFLKLAPRSCDLENMRFLNMPGSCDSLNYRFPTLPGSWAGPFYWRFMGFKEMPGNSFFGESAFFGFSNWRPVAAIWKI